MAQINAAAEAQLKAADLDPAKRAPKATGEKEKVGAWDCEIYTMETGDKLSARFWVAKNSPNYKEIMAQLNRVNRRLRPAA